MVRTTLRLAFMLLRLVEISGHGNGVSAMEGGSRSTALLDRSEDPLETVATPSGDENPRRSGPDVPRAAASVIERGRCVENQGNPGRDPDAGTGLSGTHAANGLKGEDHGVGWPGERLMEQPAQSRRNRRKSTEKMIDLFIDRFDAVIFDMDGVVTDSAVVHEHRLEGSLRRLSSGLERTTVARISDPSMKTTTCITSMASPVTKEPRKLPRLPSDRTRTWRSVGSSRSRNRLCAGEPQGSGFRASCLPETGCPCSTRPSSLITLCVPTESRPLDLVESPCHRAPRIGADRGGLRRRHRRSRG